MNVTMETGPLADDTVGVLGHFARVAARADRINSLERPSPSFLNAEQTHAPAHSCFAYSGNGQDVTQ
jgi:hypothetical protein